MSFNIATKVDDENNTILSIPFDSGNIGISNSLDTFLASFSDQVIVSFNVIFFNYFTKFKIF